jgi:hypothetical protein
MKRTGNVLVAIIFAALQASGRPVTRAQSAVRASDILPAEGLVVASVVPIRDQAALDAHYYLADERILGLDGKASAVFARYRAAGGEALVLVVSYPTEAAAAGVYGRFGRDFFPGGFDPQAARVVEELESGDAAGAVRVRSALIVVLEAPDRKSCDELLRRLEERALALF